MSSLLAADLAGNGDDWTAARFVVPGLPRHFIRRDRLNCLLSSAVQNSLTIVTGSPGAGKSVLLADWCREQADDEVSWLRLDASDNDPETFWSRVSAALNGGGSGHWSGRDRTQGGAGHRAGDRAILKIRKLSQRVLVMDDFHHITDPGIIAGVAGLVRDLPPHVRLVLIGRHIHGAPLKHLSLRGEVMALTDADLRFTVQEAAALISLVSGRYLPLEAVETLAGRCEGWATGLHLAATALCDENDADSYVAQFGGASAPVADYLEHEALLCEPPGLVTFFLQTSVLEDLTPDLCCAVTGRSDAGEILAWLADSNFFVVPVEGALRRYRYHRLFADLLRSRLERKGSLASEAHGQAGAWFEQSGDFRSAARHFALAGAFDRALRLAFPTNPLVSKGDRRQSEQATEMFDIVPSHVENDPARLYIVAAALLTAERPNEALTLLRRLEALTADTTGAARWKGRVEFLWALQSDRAADPIGSLDHCHVAEELMRLANPPASSSGQGAADAESWLDAIDATISDQLPLLAARAHSWLGEPDEAGKILVNRYGSQDRAEAAAPSMFAIMACRKGLLGDSERFANETLRRQLDQPHTGGESALEAHLALADVSYERNDLAGALEHLEVARESCRSSGGVHWTLSVDIDVVRVMVAQQRPREALSRLWQLRRVDWHQPASSALLQRLNEVEIACRILVGDLEGVLLLARSTRSGDFRPETLALIDLFTGRPDRVLARLRLAPSTSLATDIRRVLLVACADAQRGDILRAEERVRRATDCGRPEGYVRPFLEQARLTLPILRSILGTAGDPYLAHIVHEAEQLAPDTTTPSVNGLIEPLTERERELLTYLATHFNLREIAGRMYLSHNTVKTHVKAIYRKIGAGSRAEAVALARARGIL